MNTSCALFVRHCAANDDVAKAAVAALLLPSCRAAAVGQWNSIKRDKKNNRIV